VKTERFSELIHHLGDGKPIAIGTALERLGERGHALSVLVFGAPFLFPLPLPGLSMPFGVVLLVVGTRMSRGLGPWLPPRWARREIPASTARGMVRAAERILGVVECMARPRGRWNGRRAATTLNGFAIATCGALLALPLPPGTNFPPASAALLISLGILEEDDVFLFLGYAALVVNLAFFALLAYFGAAGFEWLWTRVMG
jgi:hypothetical protein